MGLWWRGSAVVESRVEGRAVVVEDPSISIDRLLQVLRKILFIYVVGDYWYRDKYGFCHCALLHWLNWHVGFWIFSSFRLGIFKIAAHLYLKKFHHLFLVFRIGRRIAGSKIKTTRYSLFNNTAYQNKNMSWMRIEQKKTLFYDAGSIWSTLYSMGLWRYLNSQR